MDWTDAQINQLKMLWAQGHTVNAIGGLMRLSKNSVVGKAHRLGLKARPSPIRPAVAKREGATPSQSRAESKSRVAAAKRQLAALETEREPKTHRSAPAPVPAPSPASSLAPAPVAGAPAVMPRPARHRPPECCTWPIGEPRTPGFRYCDAELPAGQPGPYCAAHHALAYEKPPPPCRLLRLARLPVCHERGMPNG